MLNLCTAILLCYCRPSPSTVVEQCREISRKSLCLSFMPVSDIVRLCSNRGRDIIFTLGIGAQSPAE